VDDTSSIPSLQASQPIVTISLEYSLQAYISPPYASPKHCYPQSVQFQPQTSKPVNGNSSWIFPYHSNWTWPASTLCLQEGLINFGSDVNISCDSKSCSWFQMASNQTTITAILSIKNQTLTVLVTSTGKVYSFQMDTSVPSPPPMHGTYYMSSYVSPSHYVAENCYPDSLQIEKAGVAPIQEYYYWNFAFEFVWSFPSTKVCEDVGFIGNMTQSVNVTTSNRRVDAFEKVDAVDFWALEKTPSFNGRWFSENSSLDLTFTQMLQDVPLLPQPLTLSVYGAKNFMFAMVQVSSNE